MIFILPLLFIGLAAWGYTYLFCPTCKHHRRYPYYGSNPYYGRNPYYTSNIIVVAEEI